MDQLLEQFSSAADEIAEEKCMSDIVKGMDTHHISLLYLVENLSNLLTDGDVKNRKKGTKLLAHVMHR